MPSFFFHEFQLLTVLLLICDQARLSKTMFGIFHFRFRLVFIKVYSFCSTKCMKSLTLKRHS